MTADDIARHLAFSQRFGGKFRLPTPEPTQEEAQAILHRFNSSFDQFFGGSSEVVAQLRKAVEPYAVHVDPRKQDPA